MLLRVNRHPEGTVEKVLELYASGKSIETIRKELSLGKNFVHKILKQNSNEDRQLRKRKIKIEYEQPICLKYKEGLSPKEIAKEFGCTTTTVRKIVKRNNIELNTRGGQTKRIPEDLKLEAIEMYKNGASQETIAKKIGYANQKHVCYLLDEWGVKKRNPYPVGEEHHTWKGGRHITNYGYVYIRLRYPEDRPFEVMAGTTGYVLEHRLVMAKYLGRPLETHEVVHHIDGDKLNNSLSNLQLMFTQPKGASLCCRKCGSFDLEAKPLGTSVETIEEVL